MFIMHILSNGTVAALLRCAQFKVVADYTVLMCQRYECFTTKKPQNVGPLLILFPMLKSHRTGLCLLPLIIVLKDKVAAPVRIKLLSVW